MSRVTRVTQPVFNPTGMFIPAAPDFVSPVDIADRFHFALILLGTINEDFIPDLAQLHGRFAFFSAVTGWCWHNGITEGLDSILELHDNEYFCWSKHFNYVLRRLVKDESADYVRSAKAFLREILSLVPRDNPFWWMIRDAIIISQNPMLPRFLRGVLMRSLDMLDEMKISWPDPDQESSYRYVISDQYRHVIITGKHAIADMLKPLIEHIYSHDLPEGVGYECYFQETFCVGRKMPAVSLRIFEDELIFTAVNCIA